MWTTSNGYTRALASVATAGAVAFAASGVTAMPAAALPGPLPSATVVAPVELTALSGDSSLMDIIGTLTGLNWIIPLLDNPDYPWFPFVISLEALGELFVIIPVTLVIGTPLLLLTEGWQGIQDTFTLLGTAVDAVQTLFDELVDWYQTRNWFTGQLLDTGSSEAVAVAGWADLFHTGGVEDVVVPVSLDDAFTVGAVDAGLPVDGFDAVLTDFGLGDLVA
ncbi:MULTISPECIES: hypothetical protein [unclassified Mycobacterium]|uniref:hypothetical protein n=1 Tax=unclassified Mycobacterium TaxID=2642494 RepID=UPI00046566DF|nr:MULTISPECIES: hypothetical protein [unclassified Mycobacterium]